MRWTIHQTWISPRISEKIQLRTTMEAPYPARNKQNKHQSSLYHSHKKNKKTKPPSTPPQLHKEGIYYRSIDYLIQSGSKPWRYPFAKTWQYPIKQNKEKIRICKNKSRWIVSYKEKNAERKTEQYIIFANKKKYLLLDLGENE